MQSQLSCTMSVMTLPTNPRLLNRSSLVWEGSFKLPLSQSYNDDELMRQTNFSYLTHGLEYNPNNNSLFISGHDWYQRIGEISIPELIKSQNIASLKRASIIQPLTNYQSRIPVFETDANGCKTGGILIANVRLIVSVYQYYDGDGNAKRSHIIFDNLNLASNIQGEFIFASAAGHVAGYMGTIPLEWQDRLGSKYITGQCGLAITSRTSSGPSLFGFDPEQMIDTNTIVPTIPYVDYPFSIKQLMPFSSNNSIYNATSYVTGVLFPDNTDSVWFFGGKGLGKLGYGEGVYNRLLDGLKSPGGYYCYDPCDNNKGYHGYPYSSQIWAYDANEFLAVKNGNKKPWEVKPYDVWTFELPIHGCKGAIGGLAFDKLNKRVFITALSVAQYGEALIHSFKLN